MRLLATGLLIFALTSPASAQQSVEGTFSYLSSYEPRGSAAGGYLHLYADAEGHRVLIASQRQAPDDDERLVRVRYRPRARRVVVSHAGQTIALEVHGEPLEVERIPVRVDAFRWVARYDAACMSMVMYRDEYLSLDGTTRLFVHAVVARYSEIAIIRYHPLPAFTTRFSTAPCMGDPPTEHVAHGSVLAIEGFVRDEAEARARLGSAAAP